MRVYVQESKYQIESEFLSAFASTLGNLGHTVERNSPPSRRVGLSVLWGVHGPEVFGPRLYVELGWLPRWSYQVSSTGINADHHLAHPKLSMLNRTEEARVFEWLDSLRDQSAPYVYMRHDTSPSRGLPKGFILCPFQVETDVNMQHAPKHLRTCEGLVDALTEWNPPYPIVYKAHPNSRARYQDTISPGRDQDIVRADKEGNIHSYLRHTYCQGVVTINSNTAHDALLWGKPVIALGDGFWPKNGPFLSGLPSEWESFKLWHTSSRTRRLRLAYADHLRRSQWSIEDARDAERVGEAVRLACGRV